MNTADANKVIAYLSEQIKEQALTIAMLRAHADELRAQNENKTEGTEDAA